MRITAQPQIDLNLIETASVSMRAWLVSLLVWFVDVLDALPPWAFERAYVRDWSTRIKSKVAADLRMSVRMLALMLVGAAFARVTAPRAEDARQFRPEGAAHGFRRSRKHKRFIHCATASALRALNEGSLRRRAERLRARLDQFDALVLRVLKRLTAMYRLGRTDALVLVTSHDACVNRPPMRAIAAADTS